MRRGRGDQAVYHCKPMKIGGAEDQPYGTSSQGNLVESTNMIQSPQDGLDALKGTTLGYCPCFFSLNAASTFQLWYTPYTPCGWSYYPIETQSAGGQQGRRYCLGDLLCPQVYLQASIYGYAGAFYSR